MYFFSFQIGSFFMINLCLVVIATQFSETKKREMERMRLERSTMNSSSSLTSNSFSEPTGCYNEIVKYIAHLTRYSHALWNNGNIMYGGTFLFRIVFTRSKDYKYLSQTKLEVLLIPLPEFRILSYLTRY